MTAERIKNNGIRSPNASAERLTDRPGKSFRPRNDERLNDVTHPGTRSTPTLRGMLSDSLYVFEVRGRPKQSKTSQFNLYTKTFGISIIRNNG